MSNFWARHGATEKRVLQRSTESLLGLCTGLLADGLLSDQEIVFLRTWHESNQDCAGSWPGEVLLIRVREVLEDGHISEDERAYLVQTLQDILGGVDVQSDAPTTGPTSLAYTDVDQVEIPGRVFCFTGNFVFGSRSACEGAVSKRGGSAIKNITQKLNYLVIGEKASREWAHSTYGRKIEKAIEYQAKGLDIAIVPEALFVASL